MNRFQYNLRILAMGYLFLLLAGPAMGQATASPDSARWEIGLRIGQLAFANETLETDRGTRDRHSTYIGMKAYGLRHLKDGYFLRGALGLSGSEERRSTLDTTWNLPLAESRLGALIMEAEAAVGFQFPRSSKKHLDKLQLRSGLLLHASWPLQSEWTSNSYSYDSLGNLENTSVSATFRPRNYSLQLAVFFQLTCDVMKRWRLGLEWQHGPSMDFTRSKIHNEATTEVFVSRSFQFRWDLNIPRPAFSIAYTF